MKNVIIIVLLLSLSQNNFGQNLGNPYETCLNKYILFKQKMTIIKNMDSITLVKSNPFFELDNSTKNVKFLSEKDIFTLIENEGVINLIEIKPVVFEKNYLIINVTDCDVSGTKENPLFLLKGGGIYKIFFDCISSEYKIVVISENI